MGSSCFWGSDEMDEFMGLTEEQKKEKKEAMARAAAFLDLFITEKRKAQGNPIPYSGTDAVFDSDLPLNFESQVLKANGISDSNFIIHDLRRRSIKGQSIARRPSNLNPKPNPRNFHIFSDLSPPAIDPRSEKAAAARAKAADVLEQFIKDAATGFGFLGTRQLFELVLSLMFKSSEFSTFNNPDISLTLEELCHRWPCHSNLEPTEGRFRANIHDINLLWKSTDIHDIDQIVRRKIAQEDSFAIQLMATSNPSSIESEGIPKPKPGEVCDLCGSDGHTTHYCSYWVEFPRDAPLPDPETYSLVCECDNRDFERPCPKCKGLYPLRIDFKDDGERILLKPRDPNAPREEVKWLATFS